MLSRIKLLPPLLGTNSSSALTVLANRFSSMQDGSDEENDIGNESESMLRCMCLHCSCPDGPDQCKVPNCYDDRKFRHCLPESSTCLSFAPVTNFPTDIFRCTAGECLGPQGQAAKHLHYKNPEYFAYHHMSFHDIDFCLSKYRGPAPITNRKP